MKCVDCKLFEECSGSMQTGTDCFVPREKGYDITSESAFHNYDLGYEEGYKRGKKDAAIHAHWERTEAENVYGGIQIKCSNCGNTLMSSPEHIDNEFYCCHCGAKMDGDPD